MTDAGDAVEDIEIQLLLEALYRRYHFDFRHYARASIKRRLKQANLVGPAGFVSMEDGCIGGFVQRGAMAAGEELSVVEMGGAEAKTTDTRATETAVRGFWQVYRRLMGI